MVVAGDIGARWWWNVDEAGEGDGFMYGVSDEYDVSGCIVRGRDSTDELCIEPGCANGDWGPEGSA